VAPARHGPNLARHERRFVAGQEGDHVGDLLGPAQTPEQASIEDALMLALGEPLDDAGADETWSDATHVNVRREFLRQAARQ
jgi:hypothetical protein